MRLWAGLILFALSPAGAQTLPDRLESWRKEIEGRGGQVIVVPVAADGESGVFRIPAETPRRGTLARYAADPRFAAQFARAQAITINTPAPEGRVHFVLLNLARQAEWKASEEALLAHEFGHAWLDALGYASLELEGESEPCLAIHAGDIVQHVLIRKELEARGIEYRDFWTHGLEQALDALKAPGAVAGEGACGAVARMALWADVRMGLSAERWKRYDEFEREFGRRFPDLAPAVDEMVTVLRAVDLASRDRYGRALAFVRRRLAVSAGLEREPAAGP